LLILNPISMQQELVMKIDQILSYKLQ